MRSVRNCPDHGVTVGRATASFLRPDRPFRPPLEGITRRSIRMTESTPVTPPACVAIIDDETSVRVGLRRLLEVFGLRTTVHASGAEFVAWLEGGAPRPDCLLLDAHMPDLSGLELHRHLVSRGVQIPTIVFTADDSAELLAHGSATGIVASLRKPVSGDDLLVAVERALSRKAQP